MLAMTTKPDRRVTKINFPLRERKKKKITFLRVQMVFEDSELNACEFVSLSVKSYVCALTPGSFPTPRLWAWACFREPRCHLPPNSNSVVDQQLFTNRQEDGTNLITPYSLVFPLSGDRFNLSSSYVLGSRPPQVESDSNYEYRVPLKWPWAGE